MRIDPVADSPAALAMTYALSKRQAGDSRPARRWSWRSWEPGMCHPLCLARGLAGERAASIVEFAHVTAASGSVGARTLSSSG